MNFKLSNLPYRKAISDLASLRFIENGDNVLFIGTSGVGKTHLATGLGVEATKSHISTYFIHFHDLIGRLRKAVRNI